MKMARSYEPSRNWSPVKGLQASSLVLVIDKWNTHTFVTDFHGLNPVRVNKTSRRILISIKIGHKRRTLYRKGVTRVMRHGVHKSGTGDADTNETSVLCSNSSLDRIYKNLANA